MTSKGETRRARKAAAAAGLPWVVAFGDRVARTAAEGNRRRRREQREWGGLDAWARYYEARNGAPDGEGDR